MRKFILPMALVAMALVLGSCGSTKNVAYFQNSDVIDEDQSSFLYDARILPKDQLTITVSTTNPEAAVPFNLTIPTPYNQQSYPDTLQSTISQHLFTGHAAELSGG